MSMIDLNRRVLVIGAGWSGAVVAERLTAAGCRVDVFERANVVGGHSRAEVLEGVVYEPNGPHIFHTSNPEVASYVRRFGMDRTFEFSIITMVHPSPDLEAIPLSWPPQLEELTVLPNWSAIVDELNALPPEPTGADFETYVISMMGRSLYDLFVRDYTAKQWGMPATELSSSFAPKRVELRRDGNRRLFRDTWEFFPAGGANSIIERVIDSASVTFGSELDLTAVTQLQKDYDAIVVTTALDEFVGAAEPLAWRGVKLESVHHPDVPVDGFVSPAYVINWPDRRYDFTRTIETKHASGQQIRGSVVSHEYPGSPARHYPVHTVAARDDRRNREFKDQVQEALDRPVYFCGRLANYTYINQDQAIEQAFACAESVLAAFGER